MIVRNKITNEEQEYKNVESVMKFGNGFILIFADNTSSDVFDNDWEFESEKESDFMSKIMVGDKVKFNGKYEDCKQYGDREYTVRNVGIIGGERVVWLHGLSGCFAEDSLNLEAKLVERKTSVAAKIENGKIVWMNVPVAKIENGEIVEMNV